MKILLSLITVAVLSASSFGQSSRLAEAIKNDPRFAYRPAKASALSASVAKVFEVSPSLMRRIEERNALRFPVTDRITVGLMAIAENIGANELSAQSFSWRDRDRTFGFRSLRKFAYKYDPKKFSSDPLVNLDRAFGEPIRLFLTQKLSF